MQLALVTHLVLCDNPHPSPGPAMAQSFAKGL